MSVSSHWWCLHCRRVTELLESDSGLGGQRCAHCQSLRIEWRPAPACAPKLEPVPCWAQGEPEQGRKAQKIHRLPADKRKLRLLASLGYWFCAACQEVTERDKEDCCVLCGSSRVQWNEPVYVEKESS